MLNDSYLQRLNRFGENFFERVQGQREADFYRYKMMSTYHVEFEGLEGETTIGTLEPHKQDETQTLQWLLVDTSVEYEAGQIYHINDNYWMILYLKNTKSKGYNKYCVLKMTHVISWNDREGAPHTSRAYFYGKMDRIIYDVVRNTASSPNYQEPNKETHLIMPLTHDLKREDYIEIDGEGYLITGYDLSSVPGVIYFSLVESYIHDTTPKPVIAEGEEDLGFWLKGDRV